MKKFTLFPVLVLVVVTTIALQGVLPQVGYGKEGGGTHPVLRKGWIDQLGAGSVVIDDMPYRTAAGTRYFDRNGRPSGPSVLRSGQFIGFLAENGLLTDIYLLEPGPDDMRPEVKTSSRTAPEPSSEIILEDGVWRN